MKTKNKVELIGYVGHEPVLLNFPSGAKKAVIRMATDEFVKLDNGERQQITTWHDIAAWDDMADTAIQNFSVGSHILVEGKLVYRTFEDNTGHTRYVTEIKAYSFMNLDR